jgi:pimeloyl-ACP methyl ester carboxylesterase
MNPVMSDSDKVVIPNSRGFTSLFVSAPDGARLHVRRYGPRLAPAVAVVCLPGLARTAADFHLLAEALANDAAAPRPVLALDFRGHGRSDYDLNTDNYAFPAKIDDVVAVLTALESAPAVLVGTAHGGLVAMMLGVLRPMAVAGLVLNDIGPVIEPKGLMRIKRYVGKMPTPRNYQEGADIVRRLFGAQFPKLNEQEWIDFAHRTWKEHDGALVVDYDVRLASTLAAVDLERPLPPLWHQFDALARFPLMMVRGANSDVLAASTLEAMLARRGALDVAVVADQGHAPLLAEPRLIRRIADFVASCDAAPA